MKHKKAITISSNTLFHFTKNLDNLKSILKNEFYPHYSLESFNFVKNTPSKIALAMVSFCDIPLSQIKNHIYTYGFYGIGLSKNWGNKKGLNPVLYIRKNSTISISLNKTIMGLAGFLETSEWHLILKNNLQFRKSVEAFWHIIKYLKQYEGNFSREKKEYKKVRFYDEKEWRYIPDIKKSFLTEQDFHNNNIIINVKEALKKSKLCFKPRDIKYIIVKKENEVSEMIAALRNIYKNHPQNIVDGLTTRILTVEQIIDDF